MPPFPKILIVALDVSSGKEARGVVRRLGSAVDFYKVAPSLLMEDFSFIPWLKDQGKKIFLDCKWHDIPSQVERSVVAAEKMGVTSCTVHVGGGGAMLKAALEAYPRPQFWGVTVLTSLSGEDLKQVGVRSLPAGQVLRLAILGQTQGLDALVCSPQEVAFLRRNKIRLPLVTPGIQVGPTKGKDQKRTATPQAAWNAGATMLVVGRSILESTNPQETVRRILI
jgi:orotidine-5'-phosphate decarboxylase